MRRTVPVLLLIIGALAIVMGIGQLTFLAPAATSSAAVPQGVTPAPLTLITQPVRDAAGEGATLTVHADGEFRAVLGRSSDVDAWVGDAAANVVDGVDEDNEQFDVTHRAGQDKSPDPAGSDLWVTDQSHSGTWDVTWDATQSADGASSWTVPADGDWTLMLATDGTKAAPLDLTMSWDNPDATGSAKFSRAIWWFIGGVVVIAAGLALWFGGNRTAGRRREEAAATSPRRAARFAAETGQLPALPDMVPPPGAEDTADDVMAQPIRTRDDAAIQAQSVREAERRADDEAAGLSDDTIVQRSVSAADAPFDREEDSVETAGPDGATGRAPGAGWLGDAEGLKQTESSEQPEPLQQPGASLQPEPMGEAEPVDHSLRADAEDHEDEADDDTTRHDTTSHDTKDDDTTGDDDDQLPGGPADGDEGFRPGRRGGAPGRRGLRAGAVALTAAALMLPAGPALAASATPSGDASSSAGASSGTDASSGGDDTASGTATGQPTPTPVLVDVQLQRIMKQVSAATTAGDKAKDASKLGDRFSGAALQLRKDYYAAAKKKVDLDSSAVPSIAPEPLRATAVTTTQEWPRVVMVLSQGEGQTYPVAVTMEQESPRSNYSVLQAVEMVPEAKFPGVALGAPEVTTQPSDQAGLVNTPAKVVDGFADWLKNSKSSWASKFEPNTFVTDWRKQMQAQTKQVQSDDQKGHVQSSFSVDSSSLRVLSAPQGGSYVSADLTQTTVVSAEKGGTVALSGLAKQFTGKSSTDKQVVTTYRMPVFFYVPASGEGKISLVARGYLPTDVRLK